MWKIDWQDRTGHKKQHKVFFFSLSSPPCVLQKELWDVRGEGDLLLFSAADYCDLQIIKSTSPFSCSGSVWTATQQHRSSRSIITAWWLITRDAGTTTGGWKTPAGVAECIHIRQARTLYEPRPWKLTATGTVILQPEHSALYLLIQSLAQSQSSRITERTEHQCAKQWTAIEITVAWQSVFSVPPHRCGTNHITDPALSKTDWEHQSMRRTSLSVQERESKQTQRTH